MIPEVQSPQPVSQGALFTTPIPLASLEAENQTCPICREPYIEPFGPTYGQDSDREWPVSVDMVAEQVGRKRCCGHILGRQCLEKHLRASGEWRNKCPICRDIWFNNSIASNAPPEHEPQENVQHELRELSTLRRSSRIAAQSTRRRNAPVPRMRDRHGVRQRREHEPHRVELSQTPSFISQLFGALEVEHESALVKGTLEDVERRLEALYGDENQEF